MFNTNLPCGERGDTHPYLWPQPALQARFTDGDAGDSLNAEFRIWPVEHPDQSTVLTQNIFRSGYVSGVSVPAGLLTDGTRYAWQTRLSDGTDTSGWSHTCYFTTDGTRPATAPGVVSPNYPDNGEFLPGGTPAHFTFSASGVSDVIGYMYSWTGLGGVGGYSIGPDGSPIGTDPLSRPGSVRAPRLGGSASVDLSPPRAGINQLFVESLDRAYNASPVATYQILVQDTAPAVTPTGPIGGPGQPITLKFTPNPNLTSVDSYTYQVNSNAAVTVPAGPDGSASVSVTPSAFGQFGVRVTSHSPNGWVSPEALWSVQISSAPRISSDVYPPLDDTGTGPGGGGVGVTGTFTLTAGHDDVLLLRGLGRRGGRGARRERFGQLHLDPGCQRVPRDRGLLGRRARRLVGLRLLRVPGQRSGLTGRQGGATGARRPVAPPPLRAHGSG
jgi:hypothetical protein